MARDFVPAQDVWLSFGAREEVSGPDAQLAVEALRQFGVRPWLVLDEGGAIAHQAFPGIDPPLGVIGVTEKGTTTVELVADGRGGHSSTPATDGPTARIARAVTRLERHRVGTHGLLLRWAGTAADRPVVLMAHQDVVPVDASAPWQHPPFAAEVHDGAVWGRGTLDDKGALTAIC